MIAVGRWWGGMIADEGLGNKGWTIIAVER